MPEYREGDAVSPGRPVADVIEAGRMEMRAKVDENDRANLNEGQDRDRWKSTRSPGEKFPAKVGALAGLVNRDFFESRRDASVRRDVPVREAGREDEGRRVAAVTIEGKEIRDALTVPRQAVFQKNGKTHVFVKTGDRFEQREIKIVQRTESRAAIEGLPEGTEVALVDPTIKRTSGLERDVAAARRWSREVTGLGSPVAETVDGDAISAVGARVRAKADFLPELRLGFDNLRAHKLRSLLTMLGMIFGVAAVVAMLSIGAGAQQEVMAFIEQLGVRNLIVEAREASDWQTLQKVRKTSAGLTFQDYRVIQANLEGITTSTARKRFTPTKLLPRPQGDTPVVYGVSSGYVPIANIRVVSGRFFDEAENVAAMPLAVLGEAAAAALFGAEDAVGRYVKVNDQWFQVDRRRRAAVDRAERRRRHPRAGPQQPDLRAALLRDLPARGWPVAVQGRDRRHLPSDAVQQRRAGGRVTAARAADRRPS